MSTLTIPDGAGGNVVLTPVAVSGTAILTLPTGTGNLLSNAVPAGNTTVAPLKFTSGTNLSTAAAGSIEYDGTAFYNTGQGTERGVMPTSQLYWVNTAVTGGNDNLPRTVFGSVGVTLSANTTYVMEGALYFTRAAGTTSHTLRLQFTGTANINAITYQVAAPQITLPSATSASGTQAICSTKALTAVTGAITTSNSIGMMIRGTVSTNAGGTFTPTYAPSVAPGGAYTVATGSFMTFTPVGATGNISVGPWA